MRRLFLYASVLLLTQCSKCKDDPQPKDPLSQLPPATQEGKNTFGCLVNGRAFTPKGGASLSPSLQVSYDPLFNGGTFSLRVYNRTNESRETIALELIPVNTTGTYFISQSGNVHNIIGYTNSTFTDSCAAPYTYLNMTYQRGSVTLLRLDLTARIASGTFAVTFARPGCDTIRLTDGRFDVKF